VKNKEDTTTNEGRKS